MTFIPWLLIFEICNSKSIPIDEIFFFKASATSFAVFNPWVNANTEGPEPEIPNPMAPASFEAFLRAVFPYHVSFLKGKTQGNHREFQG